MDESAKIFGRYEILRQIGAGGMGEIYVARQSGIPGVERSVVIKKVLPHLAQEPGFVDRFLDEMRVAASLTHGNIVQVYEAGELDGQYFMAMEYVDGMDLRRVLARLGELGRLMPEDLALYVLTEAAKGLAYAHTRTDLEGRRLNIVHRDVSPANLLVSYDGQLKLTDFGVSLATARLSFSAPGTLHGKVAYMSPEQVLGEECDARSDVFALAVVGYEILAGSRPFDAETDVATIEQVRLCEPVPLAEKGDWISASLGGIVMRALSREPSERYGSMQEFHGALAEYMVSNQVSVSAQSVADLMESLKPPEDEAGQGEGDPSRSRSLDDVAGELLDRKQAELQTPSAQQGPPDAISSRPAAALPHREGEPEWSMLQVLGAILIVGGLAGGLWLLGRLAEVPMDATDTGKPTAYLVADSGPVSPPVPDEAPADAFTAETAAATDGAGASGEARKEVAKTATPGVRRSVGVRSVPDGAQVFHGRRELGTTPLSVSLVRGGAMRLEVRLAGHEKASVIVGPDSPSWLTVRLTKVLEGRLKFRFFPANARVFLDGVPVKITGNVVDRKTAVGVHVIELRSASGNRSKKVQATVLADKTTQLGTVELRTGVEDVQ